MLPRTLRIGPFIYTVARREHDERLGECDNDKSRILIADGLPSLVERETLLHEILHAVCYVTGVTCRIGDEEEERLIRSISPTLLDVLSRNRRLRDYLSGG